MAAFGTASSLQFAAASQLLGVRSPVTVWPPTHVTDPAGHAGFVSARAEPLSVSRVDTATTSATTDTHAR